MRKTRAFEASNDAVSVIVGAVLLLGILVAFFVSIRVSFVPEWERDLEAQHMNLVSNDLIALKTGLDRQTENQSDLRLAHGVRLSTPSNNLFLGSGPADELRFEPNIGGAGGSFSVATPQIIIVEQDGQSLGAVNEQWQSVPTSELVVNASSINHFRLRIDSVSRSNHQDSVTVTVRDSDGTFAGDFRFEVEEQPGPDYLTRVIIRDASMTVILSEIQGNFQQSTISPYWVDLLRDDYRFGAVLASATAPFNVTIVEDGLQADYAISYTQTTGSGTILVGGGGRIISDYNEAYGAGRLVYAGNNNRFTPQIYSLEHGAIVLEQPDGQLFKVAPGFEASRAGNTMALNLQIPSFTGEAREVSGEGTVTVRTLPRSSVSFGATTAQLNITLPTTYPDLWIDHWNTTLEAEGLSSSGPQPGFELNKTASSATLIVYGPIADPSSAIHDISLSFRQMQVAVELEV